MVEICEDGKLYMLMPIPEGASEEDIKEAVESGDLKLRDGMVFDKAFAWEERNGEFFFDAGIEGEAFGEKTDGWVKPIDENGLFTFIVMRYERI